MKKVCWAGCSFTVGEGFDQSQQNLVYTQLVSQECDFVSTNIAVRGNSNYKIFLSACKAVVSQQFDIVFVQWSGLNRIWLHPGPETVFFASENIRPDYRYRDLYLDPAQKKNLCEWLLRLNHDYQNIVDLIDYCNILERMQSSNTKVVFINGLVPWTNDLTKPLDKSNLSKTLSKYTKEILDFDQRDDDEIIKYFTFLQDKFSTLNIDLWVNIFDSFLSHMIDFSPVGHHPGQQSHKWMAQQVSKYIKLNF